MGLDMYLYKEKNFGGINEEVKEAKVIDKNGKIVDTIKADRYGSLTITTNVAYWRKANAIHNWFCKLDDDKDECQRININIEKLRELKSTCELVKSKAKLVKGLIDNGHLYGSGRFSDKKIIILAPVKKDGRIIDFTRTGRIIDSSLIKEGDYFKKIDDSESSDNEFYQYIKDCEYKRYLFGEIIENSAEADRLLPTTDGFFFGSTDYDQYYIDDLNSTIEQLFDIIKDYDEEMKNGAKDWDISYYYQASW